MTHPDQYDLRAIPAISHPKLAQAVAHAAHDLCLQAYATQSLYAEAPLNIVLTDPAGGELAWLLANALDTRLADLPFAAPAWRICMPCTSAEAMQELAAHPYLYELFDTGRIAGVPLSAPDSLEFANPAIIVSAGTLAALPSEPYLAAHGEVWREGQTSERSVVTVDSMPSDWGNILAGYQAALNFAAFSLPQEAAELVGCLIDTYGGRGLLVALEPGFVDIKSLRTDCDAHQLLNLHALAAYQAAHGAHICQLRLADGVQLHMAWFDDAMANRYQPTGLARHFPPTLVQPTESVLQAAYQAPGQDLPHWLALAGYDPVLLAAFSETVAEETQSWSDNLITDWRRALVAAWHNYFPTPDNIDLALRFATLAWAVEDWELVRYALTAAIDFGGPEPEWINALAACEAATGQLEMAASYLEGVLVHTPDHAPTIAQHNELAPRLNAQRALCEAAHSRPDDWLLCLEPLSELHGPAFCWQYRDPQIALMADLPYLEDEVAYRLWLQEQASEAGRRNFAVMHPNHGFVGVVSYIGDEACAFVHFWIGADYQGLGFSAIALAMLAEQARADGQAVLFTSAYRDNARSSRTLDRVGFAALPLPPLKAPDNALHFFVLDLREELAQETADWVGMLDALCTRLESPLAWEVQEDEAAWLQAA